MVPSGIVATGFPSAQATCRQIGIEFDPWQVELNRLILAKNSEGLLAADVVVLSISRQVGKTFDVGALAFARCITTPNTTVIWTAHRFKVARESFNEMRGWAKSSKLTAHIDYDAITTGAGTECIPFRNGSRIIFAARERGAIRGFTKVGMLVLDEGQILTHASMADLAPTTNHAQDPLIIIMGTPPKPTDPGEVFTEMRAAALGGESDLTLYVEFSADPDSDLMDPVALAKANPSYPHRTTDRAMRRLRTLITDDDGWRREALGIWDDMTGDQAIPSAAWRDRAIPDGQIGGDPVFVLDVSPKMTHSAVAVAGSTAGGMHVGMLLREGQSLPDSRAGTDWVVPALKDLQTRRQVLTVHIAANSQAKSLVPDLELAGIDVQVIPAVEVPAACGLMYQLAVFGGLTHPDQPELNAAVSAAKWRDTGEGAQIFGRKKSTGEITPLYAATFAVWKANQLADPLNNIY